MAYGHRINCPIPLLCSVPPRSCAASRIPYVWLRPQAALERLSGVLQVCERRRRPAQVAKHCRCLSSSDPIELVRDEFKKLAERNGRVWYFREAPEREPPPQAKEVMQAI